MILRRTMRKVKWLEIYIDIGMMEKQTRERKTVAPEKEKKLYKIQETASLFDFKKEMFHPKKLTKQSCQMERLC